MILPLLLACHQTEEYILATPKQPKTNNVDTANPNLNENIDEENIDEENINTENSNQDEELENEDLIGDPIIPDDPYCPQGMVSVRDDLDEPQYCIDIFEVSLSEGILGNADQGLDWPDESITAYALSEANVIPATLFSWYQAVALCQNAGKYLCSTQEWKDACDGDILSNGQNFPYGNRWVENYCAARLGESEQVYDELQPTGSHLECRSPFGTYDQIGNAWEWTDSLISNEDGIPITHKMGGSYYSGGGNLACNNSPVTDHPPDFSGTIGTRCCTTPTYPE